jgi:hypothetical protein
MVEMHACSLEEAASSTSRINNKKYSPFQERHENGSTVAESSGNKNDCVSTCVLKILKLSGPPAMQFIKCYAFYIKQANKVYDAKATQVCSPPNSGITTDTHATSITLLKTCNHTNRAPTLEEAGIANDPISK